MKKTLILLTCAMLIASFAACGQTGGSSAPASSAPSSQASSAPASSEAAETPAEPLTASDLVGPADSALFRGTLEDFAVSDDGQTVLLLRRAVGTGYTPTLKVRLTDDTKFGFDQNQLGNGSFVEVYYGAGKTENADGSVNAIVVNSKFSEADLYYNGKLVEAVPSPDKKDEGYLLLDPLDENGMQFRFNYNAETQFYLTVADLKPGDLLNVYHSPMATRSIPPQSFATEVAPYSAPLEGELPLPAASAAN